MGAIFKKHNKWYIDYYDHNGKRVRRAVSRYKEEAELALKNVEVKIARGKYLDIKRYEPISFKDFAEKFRKRHIRRHNRSIRNQEYLLDQLVKHFGKRMMHQITANDIDDYLFLRQEGRSNSTVNSDLTMLKSMFNRANEWNDLNGYYPAKDIRKLKENNERCRYLTDEEQDRLLRACSGVTRMIVAVALKTGLRWGELINLKWNQAPQSNFVDFDNDAIFVHESLSKSKKSRYVPLAPSIKQELMDFPQHCVSGYIFVNPKTRRVYDNIKKSFRTAVKEAGIEDFRFHDLRHCFASNLVRKGIDLFVVQKLLGHASPKMSMRYAHLGNDQLKEAILIVDDPKDRFFHVGHQMDTTTLNVNVQEKSSV